jgi:hypothetical protein
VKIAFWHLQATLLEGSASAASGNIITKHRVAFIQYKESFWSYHKIEDKCRLIKSPGGQLGRRCHIVRQRQKTLCFRFQRVSEIGAAEIPGGRQHLGIWWNAHTHTRAGEDFCGRSSRSLHFLAAAQWQPGAAPGVNGRRKERGVWGWHEIHRGIQLTLWAIYDVVDFIWSRGMCSEWLQRWILFLAILSYCSLAGKVRLDLLLCQLYGATYHSNLS